jgi:cytochrome c5
MKDCVDPKKVKVMHISIDSTDSIEPPVHVPRYSMEAPKPKGGGGNAAEADYKASCAACHDSGAAGAPVVGNADDWAPRIKQGNETLYEHAIKGFNGMPPKGGNMSLSDDQVKAITDYMAEKSK